MKKLSVLFVAVFLAFTIGISACGKKTISSLEQKKICVEASAGEFTSLIEECNRFTKTISRQKSSDAKLDLLVGFIAKTTCFKQVKLLCNSCIETFPPQSEIALTASINGSDSTVVLDVLMDDDLKVLDVH
jgi:hypothetical protein